jgi:tyrosine-protein kinase
MDDPSLQDYIAVLRRRRWTVLLAVCAGALVALVWSMLQTPRYEATADLLLRPTASEDLLLDPRGQLSSPVNAERALNNEIRLIESQSIRDAVDDQYDGSLDVDDVDAEATSSETDDGMTISVRATDADAAAQLVNTYADVYIDERRTRQIDDLVAASDDIQARLDSLRETMAEVRAPLDAIEDEIARTPVDSDERVELEDERQRTLIRILPQLSPLSTRESTFISQLQQLEATEDLSQTGGVQVLTPAIVPPTPVSPKTTTNVAVGALIGLLGGIGLAFARDRLDDTVRTKETAESVTSLPTLGIVPDVAEERQGRDLVTVTDSKSSASEAYRLLRTSVKFLGIDSPIRTLLVTSAGPAEGKTVSAANLAVTLAQTGERVLLVDADLRRPRLYEIFGAPPSPGLTTALLDGERPEKAIWAVEEVPGLHLLPPGTAPPNPAELLDSTRARTVFATITERYDVVVVDSPPVVAVTDAAVMSAWADAVLLVVAHGTTSRRGLARAVELLRQVDAPLVGMILNKVPASEGYGYQGYRYDTYRARSDRAHHRAPDAEPPAAHVVSPQATGNGAADPAQHAETEAPHVGGGGGS